MSKLIKRKDGSYSKRGLWDNIRKNKGSGKKPTKDMLKQEAKIKKEENMKSMYKKGGKPSKKKVMKEAKKEGESFMVENKELSFGAPQMKMGGMMKYKDGGKKGLFDKIDATTNALYQSAAAGKANQNFDKAASFKTTSPEALENLNNKVMSAEAKKKLAIKKAQEMKKGGAKTMEPGGGGRFAAMVGKLKSKGKSEESAEAIAASIGRKKYGKGRFQAMAAAGKKKMGGKKC